MATAKHKRPLAAAFMSSWAGDPAEKPQLGDACRTRADIVVDAAFTIGKVDPRIYGSFIEHMEREVYEGLYEPDHPDADEEGFRRDIIALVREMEIPIIRYPGGNMLSGYNWEDGVGPREERPVRKDLAWCAYETNQIGTDEFMSWLSKVGAECNMAVNLGTRGMDAARNFVEYCNGDGRSTYAQMRVRNGHAEPYGIKTWCLGNEMDGDWQLGHKTAEEYGRLAHEAAKLMKKTDPDIELVACGSSGVKLPTYPEWDAIVLDHVYELVEYLSLHAYYTVFESDMQTYLGSSLQMDKQIRDIIATADYVKAKHRSHRDMYFSFDEWGLWSPEEKRNRLAWTYRWEDANAISEGSYSFADALVTGTLMNTLINHCDRVKIACQAALINHLSLINCAKGGRAWKQTIFYPFKYTSHYGRGTAYQAAVACDAYENETHGVVPTLDVAVVQSDEDGEIRLFIVNRDTENDKEIHIDLRGFCGEVRPVEHIVYEGYDLEAVNTLAADDVVPTTRDDVTAEGARATATVKAASWNLIRLAVG